MVWWFAADRMSKQIVVRRASIDMTVDDGSEHDNIGQRMSNQQSKNYNAV